MKLSHVLNRQHIGFMFKKHWQVQGKRVPIDTGIEDYLKSKGVPIQDALEFTKPIPKEKERVKIVGLFDQNLPLDENHPDFKEAPCYTLKRNNVLLEGINQAQVITKAIIAENMLPHKIEELAEITAPKAVHEIVKKAILSANVFDCEQKKLPKKKDSQRPAYNFPRILGITDIRRNNIITNKILQLVEKSSDIDISQSKYIVNDAQVNVTFQKDGNLHQFQDVSNILVTSNKPMKHAVSDDIPFVEIPNLYPIKYNITLTPEHFYDETSKYPIKTSMRMTHPHTTWLHINRTELSNIYETEVTPSQIYGRSLTHSFTVAAAYAKQMYGEDIRDLPEPIFINCIQTDGQIYHFGVLQLNTLNTDGTEGTRNVWFCRNNMKLYDSSRYFSGMPTLENYNPKVYEYINAFYHS